MTAGKGNLDGRNKNKLPSYPDHQVPLLRAGNDEDMAGAIIYLASKAGAYCTGTVVVSDGGRLSIAPATY